MPVGRRQAVAGFFLLPKPGPGDYTAAGPMKLNHGLHLAYTANIHPGETWAETFESLKTYALGVRQRVCPNQPYAIGLRLGWRAAQELSQRATLLEFHRWLSRNSCYVFTINGFPYGEFCGPCAKERVYLPDWTTPERLAYTKLLFDLLAQLLPPGVEGSVSTVPCGSKEFVSTPEEWKVIRENLWRCVEYIARVAAQTGRDLHLGLEPEPLCLLEASGEVLHLFDRLRAEHRNDPRLAAHLGVTYDTCHFAVGFEEPYNAIGCLQQHGIKLSKIHLSAALRARPAPGTRAALAALADDRHLHQVVIRRPDGSCVIYRDLDDALACEPAEAIADEATPAPEWRIHFHVPLYSPPATLFENTSDHVLGVLDVLQANPGMCSHLEIETYSWQVLPPELKDRELVDQLAAEYEWTLAQLAERGLGRLG